MVFLGIFLFYLGIFKKNQNCLIKQLWHFLRSFVIFSCKNKHFTIRYFFSKQRSLFLLYHIIITYIDKTNTFQYESVICYHTLF